MKKETIYRKVLVEDRHIGERKLCFRDNDEVYGVIYLNNSTLEWYCEDGGYKSIYGEYPTITHTVEEIQLPSDEEILQAVLVKQDKDQNQFMRGIDYILGFINNKK